MAWSRYAALTADHTQSGSSNLSNFTVLVSLTDTKFKQTGSGGEVTNVNGYDINFYSDSGLTTLLNWEMEFYDGTNGIIVAWVKVASLSHTSDTVFYVAVGNASVTTFQGGAAGAGWDSPYAVYHFSDGTTLSYADSSGNSHTLSPTSPFVATAATGLIDGGAACARNAGATLASAIATGTDNWRTTMLVKPTSVSDSTGDVFMLNGDDSGSTGYLMGRRGDAGASDDAFIALICGVAWLDSGSKLTTAWQYCVMERAGGTITFYLNGAACPNTFSTTPGTPGTQFSIGISLAHADFAGTLDEARVDKNRGADWALAEWNNYKSGSAFLTKGSWQAPGGTPRRRASIIVS